MKILYVTPYEGEKELATELLVGHELVFFDAAVTDAIPPSHQDAEVLSVFVNSIVTPEMIDSMPNLKVIALRSTGFDHVAVAHAKEKGIVVSSVPHYGSQTVAEYAFALILELSRKAGGAYELLRRTGEVDVTRFEGFDLKGKTLGVVGTGAIGRYACKIGHGFSMKVIGYDPHENEECKEQFGVQYCSLETVLREADIVTLHVPSLPETYHMINRGTLGQMKQGAYLINTARGDLVDTIALLEAVKSGHLAGAGLDVFEGERFIKDEMELLEQGPETEADTWRAFVAEHELIDLENVIVTPHVAFNSKEAKGEITKTTAENILGGLAGSPQNEVAVK